MTLYSLKDMASEVKNYGFSLRRGFPDTTTTIEIAAHIGTPLDLNPHLKHSAVPLVQSLKPDAVVDPSRYSGVFGFGEFPLHTDLAHWRLPPRYFVLRCVVSGTGVATLLLSTQEIVDRIGVSLLQRALFSTRRNDHGTPFLRRALETQMSAALLRWDPVFLLARNDSARTMSAQMASGNWATRWIELAQGDVLVIDNWRMLHGRTAVPESARSRCVERVYLERLHDG